MRGSIRYLTTESGVSRQLLCKGYTGVSGNARDSIAKHTDANITVMSTNIPLVQRKEDLVSGTAPDVGIRDVHEPGIIEPQDASMVSWSLRLRHLNLVQAQRRYTRSHHEVGNDRELEATIVGADKLRDCHS